MAADLVTRLLLDNKQFDNNIQKSTKQIRDFQKQGDQMKKSFNSAIGVVGKFAGGIGLAMGGMEAFNKTIAGSQTLTDSFGSAMEQTKASVDTFFSSLATGDFSNFSDRMSDAIRLAREFYAELDTLESMALFQGNSTLAIQNKMGEARNIIKDKSSSKEDIAAAQKVLKDSEKELEALVKSYGNQAQKAYISSLRAGMAVQGAGSMSDDELLSIFGDFNQYDKAVKQYQEMEKQRKAAQIVSKAYVGGSQYSSGTLVDVATDTKESLAIANDPEYKRLRAIAELNDNNITKAKEYQAIALSSNAQLIAAKGANLRGLNKDIEGNSTTKNQNIHGTENINVGFNVHYTDVDRLLDPDGILQTMSRDGVIIPIALEVQENLPQESEIDFTEKAAGLDNYISSLNGVASAMGAISGATDNSAAAWLSYSANVIGSVAQMLPLLAAQFNITSALAVAESAKLPPPFNIIAMAATGSALIATIASLPKFETGGIVGGNSYSGDNILARVNSGEMILNGAQQANLFSMINQGANQTGGNVQFKISGRDLEGVLSKNNQYNRRVK